MADLVEATNGKSDGWQREPIEAQGLELWTGFGFELRSCT